jgi:PAS domain S-box-containing protein
MPNHRCMTPAALFNDPGLLAQAIAQASEDAIFVKDLQGRYQFANPATLAALGCPQGPILGRTDAEVLAGHEAARQLMESDRQVLSGGQPLEVEEPVPQPGGTERYWLTRKMPLRDEAGHLVGLLGIARDITQRKLAEQHSDATRLKLEMAIQAAGLVMAEIDYRTNQNHISAELARLLELGEGAMTVPRQAIFDRIHPEDRERYLQAIGRTVDPAGNGHLVIDVRVLLPSGTVRWLHICLQVTFSMFEGRMQPDRGICAAREVTSEMVAERRMRAAQRLAESVIEGAGALVYAKDMEGRYILSNQAWRSLHGMSPGAAHGVTDAQIFGEDVAAVLRENDRRVAQTGEPLVVQERAVLRGQPVVYRSSKFPLYDETGEIYAVCGVSTDITDVVEADRRKDEFIATLAHELRNPLAPIRTGLEILRRVGELPPAAARARDAMQRQLSHMVRLVDDLLDVSRISRHKLELRPEPLELRSVLEHALEASQPAIEAVGHTIRLQLPEQRLRVQGDLTRLAQVVSNLLSNAAKYTPPGGTITVDLKEEDGQAVIRVQDNGMGIPPEVLPQLFTLFVQAGRERAPGAGGLGIGLWLVKRLVDLHHGSIEARSEGPGRGSTFTVRLPLLS